MNRENQDIDKLTRDLLKKSIQIPATSDFDDQLMEKILLLPSPAKLKSNGNSIKKAWLFLTIALVCFLVSIMVIGQFSGGYFKDMSAIFSLIQNYVLYGGLVLFVPLVFYHFDALVQLAFSKKEDTFLLT